MIFFLETKGEVEVDKFKKTPLYFGANIVKDEIVKIFAILHKNIPSSSNNLLALRLTSVILQSFHYLFNHTDEEHS